ncbi:MAG: hypothetical protein ABJF50_09620 [Paracoccaceae bacterium]
MLVAEINDGGKVGEPDDLVIGFFALFGWVVPLKMFLRQKRMNAELKNDTTDFKSQIDQG